MSSGRIPFQPKFISLDYAVFIDPDLSHAAKLLFARLKLYAGHDGKAYPKHDTLAREMCLSDRQVRTVLAELKALNRIAWTRTRGSCQFTIKPPEDWKKSSDQDRKESSDLNGRKPPIKTGRKVPTEKKYRNHHQNGSWEERNPGLSAEAVSSVEPRVEHQTPRPLSLKVDDEKPQDPKPVSYASPEAELKAIFLEKTGAEISLDLERRIWDAVEIRNIARKQFIDELRKHVPNRWRNPAGFLTNFARKIGIVATPAPRPKKLPEPPMNGLGRCHLCNGIGRIDEAYCECRMGRDLRAVEARPAKHNAEGSLRDGPSQGGTSARAS
jgi:helix-turn-helix protein